MGVLAAVLVVGIILGAGWYWLHLRRANAASIVAPITSKVIRGQFLHEVTERGEIADE